MKTEFVDVYDESLEITGITERETAHRIGSLHKTAQWWLIDSDSVYFQIRGKNVAFPGLLDATVGGHISAGESAEEALLREIEEEVGIRLRTSELTFVGQNKFDYKGKGVHVREFSEVYFTKAKKKFRTFRPDPTELYGVAAVPFRFGRELIQGKTAYLSLKVMLADEKERNETLLEIGKKSFVPGNFVYFERVLEIGELFAKGERQVRI